MFVKFENQKGYCKMYKPTATQCEICGQNDGEKLQPFLPDGKQSSSDLMGLCKNCYRNEYKKRFFSIFPELPKLKGTEKQIKYAEDLIIKYAKSLCGVKVCIDISINDIRGVHPIRKTWDEYFRYSDKNQSEIKKKVLERIKILRIKNCGYIPLRETWLHLALLFVDDAATIIDILKYK